MKHNMIYRIGAIVLLLLSIISCSDKWLEPKPLSFYTPENTFVNAEGFEAALSNCEYYMNGEFNGDGCPQVTEMVQSDVAVEGTTDKAGPQMNMDIALLPDAALNHVDYTRVYWYWWVGYLVIKSANCVISRIDDITWSSEKDRNRILGQEIGRAHV